MLKNALQIYLEQTWQGELHRKSDNKLLSYLFWANRILLVYVPIQQCVSAWVLLRRWLLLLPVILAGRMCRIYRHSMAYSKWHCPLVPKSQCAQSILARRAHSTRRCIRRILQIRVHSHLPHSSGAATEVLIASRKKTQPPKAAADLVSKV